MKKYKVAISDNVYLDLEDIGNFILSKYTQSSVTAYLKNMYDDISLLEYMADVLPYSDNKTIKGIHPNGKRLLSKNRHWNIIFHIEGDYVIVDRIIASSMIK